MATSTSSLVSTVTETVAIPGQNDVNLSVTHFNNMTQVIITQSGALGTLLLATPDTRTGGGLSSMEGMDQSTSIHITTLLGRRDIPGLEIATRGLAQRVYNIKGPRQVLASFGLEGEGNSLSTLQLIIQTIEKLLLLQ